MFKTGDRVFVDYPPFELHHGIHGVVSEVMHDGMLLVSPDGGKINQGRRVTSFVVEPHTIKYETDFSAILTQLSATANALRNEAEQFKAEATALRRKALVLEARYGARLQDAAALEKAAAVVDKARTV